VQVFNITTKEDLSKSRHRKNALPWINAIDLEELNYGLL
jgi:hypothetical protein